MWFYKQSFVQLESPITLTQYQLQRASTTLKPELWRCTSDPLPLTQAPYHQHTKSTSKTNQRLFLCVLSCITDTPQPLPLVNLPHEVRVRHIKHKGCARRLPRASSKGRPPGTGLSGGGGARGRGGGCWRHG